MKRYWMWRVTSDSGVINMHNNYSKHDLAVYRSTNGYKVERVLVLR